MTTPRKSRKPGKGVVANGIGAKVSAAADDLFASADAVVIVAVRFSGSGDSDEQIVRATRGPRMAVSKALDQLYDFDEREAAIYTDDQIVEDDETE